MAYVIWRVFMKKYSKIRMGIQQRQLPVSSGDATDDLRAIEKLTIEEQLEVNPCNDPIPLGPPEGRWEEKPDVGSSTSSSNSTSTSVPDFATASAAASTAADGDAPPPELAPSGSLRKSSSKAKRVKSYLKKCKDAALSSIASVAGAEDVTAAGAGAGAEDVVADAEDVAAPVRRRRASSKRRSGGRDSQSTTSWYVGAEEPLPQQPGCPDAERRPSEIMLNLGVEVFDEGAAEELLEELAPLEEAEPGLNAATAAPDDPAPAAASVTVTASEATATTQPPPPPPPPPPRGSDGAGEVLDSRNEGGTIPSSDAMLGGKQGHHDAGDFQSALGESIDNNEPVSNPVHVYSDIPFGSHLDKEDHFTPSTTHDKNLGHLPISDHDVDSSIALSACEMDKNSLGVFDTNENELGAVKKSNCLDDQDVDVDFNQRIDPVSSSTQAEKLGSEESSILVDEAMVSVDTSTAIQLDEGESKSQVDDLVISPSMSQQVDSGVAHELEREADDRYAVPVVPVAVPGVVPVDDPAEDGDVIERFFDARETLHEAPTEPEELRMASAAEALVAASRPEAGRSMAIFPLTPALESPLGQPMAVAGLAERLLRPAYGPLWALVRAPLVRQARDLLVTGFSGDLPRFRRRFLEPAAALLRALRLATAHKGGDAVSVRGWPLTLGSRGAVALHLGEIDPTLLRSRDCYLCVRPHAEEGDVEVALVWRGAQGTPASRPLPAPTPSPRTLALKEVEGAERPLSPSPSPPPPAIDSALAMEEVAMAPVEDPTTGEQALPALLNTLLVSVELALERVPLEELAFPCPQCREACACACAAPPPAPVQKRDSSMQTSPMLEVVAGPIPHIDSDDDGDDDGEDEGGAKATQTPSRAPPAPPATPAPAATRAQFKMAADDPPEQMPEAPPPQELLAPRNITDLPERLLFAGVQLPGTLDRRGRPLLVALASELAAAAPEPHSLAALLLYYCSLPGPSEEEQQLGAEAAAEAEAGAVPQSKELSLLVVSSAQEATALSLLDRALALVHGRVCVDSALVWRATGARSTPAEGTLPSCGLRYAAVRGAELREYVAEEQAPPACGGRAMHDQREWVAFHKEVEPLRALCLGCGRRLASAMGALRASEGAGGGRRRLHAQQRALARALADAELQRLRREGPATLQRLAERAAALPHSHALRRSAERARRLWEEVDRAARRLEQLCEGRRERLRDLARVRALEEEAAQVLSWLCKKGEETLRRHTNLATNLSAIKEQEQDFEKFYFISMRHLDKGSDLLEEAAVAAPGAAGAGPGAEAPRSASSGGLRELARSLKQHLLGFSERLEDTRERLEDTSRCFCLLDKAYEWALETMKYMSRVKADDAQTPEQTLQQLTRLRQYLMAHPPPPDDHFHEMLALARKLANDKLLEQAKVAHARCQETTELIREQQARLVRTRQQLGLDGDDVPYSPSRAGPAPAPAPASSPAPAPAPQTPTPAPGDAPLGWSPSGAACSTPISTASTASTAAAAAGSAIGRRRSVGSFPYIYKCSHHAAGHACACWDESATAAPAPAPAPAAAPAGDATCTCARAPRPSNPLGDIREVRESAEDLLEEAAEAEAEAATEGDAQAASIEKVEVRVCSRCGGTTSSQSLTAQALPLHKRYLRRSCTWQYPTEGFDEEDTLCDAESGEGHVGDGSATDGSEGCTKGGDDLEDQEGVANKSVPPVPVNSHLHCHDSSLDLQASLQNASTKDLKIQKTLLLIMREMIQTERDYVKSLEYVIENYIPELMREDIPQALRGQRNVIFGNIEKIFEFHSQYFLQELERCENSPLNVGSCFLRHEKKFYLYALYNKNKPKSDSLMSEYGSSFFKAKQLELGDKMDLASYLLKPVQRMGKYALLLQQLMKAYPEKDTDVTDIKAAEQMVRFQLRHGNDLLAMDSLRDCDVNVKEQGRLLRQNEFLVWQGKGKKCLRQVFLFEELILFSKARRFPDRKNLDLYIYKNSMKMTDIGLTAKIGDSPTKFEIWFRKRKPNDTFTLQSMSEDIKQAWTEEISNLLWKQALRNREMRLAEMSSMGIGNKPCLDIRPSADQISDRSISIAQLSKTAPRFRNSISVSSGELLRSNKRPHSIISVSSSSSGGSSSSSTSHSSGSTYGALVNLGFDPADSPRMHHRSTTLHSQCSAESGIIADISLGSDDADGCGQHWHVERSNSSVTSMSLDSSMSPSSPMSPSEENKTCLHPVQQKDDSYASRTNDNETDQEEVSVKL